MQVLCANFVRMSSIQVAANMSTATNVWKPLSVQYVGMNTFQMKLFPTICTLVLNRILHHENCMACGPCTRERECMCSPTAIVFTRNAQFSLASKRLVMGCIYIYYCTWSFCISCSLTSTHSIFSASLRRRFSSCS